MLIVFSFPVGIVHVMRPYPSELTAPVHTQQPESVRRTFAQNDRRARVVMTAGAPAARREREGDGSRPSSPGSGTSSKLI